MSSRVIIFDTKAEAIAFETKMRTILGIPKKATNKGKVVPDGTITTEYSTIFEHPDRNSQTPNNKVVLIVDKKVDLTGGEIPVLKEDARKQGFFTDAVSVRDGRIA